ncbi:sulfotransferase 6B1-like isoform X2 [Rhinatrema bivittatum]|uniref:sulfotransferase 6B1-like isoform X2 n=1 Tax=Rhinatrema bivittatum TaxID=194408 RepID=UPI00112CC7B1|nr:sulfotransferase 6B1-like isoform X2 [Rhinatrema bivittatum]
MNENRKLFLKNVDKIYDSASKRSPGELQFTYEGILYPTTICSLGNFQALEGFEAIKDDVILVTYPKSGTMWVYQIIQEIVYTATNRSPSSDISLIELGAPDHLECLKQQPSPRVLHTHLHYNNIPTSIFKTTAKKLVLFRNPKDTAVSYFHFYNSSPMFPTFSTWDEFFKHFMSGKVCWGSYFESLLTWNKHLDDEDVMIITYEDLKENLVAGVKQIAEFLGFPLNQKQIQAIADQSTFQNMKVNYQGTHSQFAQALFRKGVIGDWRNYFSPAQNQEMDTKFKEYLGETKLGAKLKYDTYCKA